MTKPVIEISNLSKRYRLGGMRSLDQTFREMIMARAAALFRRSNDQTEKRRDVNEFWALRDISFEVARGEVIGVIGANGAGKSTLLKILSRITDPTEGQAVIRGRVGSLLEVGTGFHPELSGRENIYLNGAILGMKKREIDARFDQIVEFSGIAPFLETPVKRYSSGMTVRLAFAVAAHLDPEVLIVDEVLAVGDTAFQEKCLGKIKQVASGQGRTVLFVSHNMNAVASLCQRAVWLEGGRIRNIGPAEKIVEQYLGGLRQRGGASYQCDESPNHQAWIAGARLLNADNRTANAFSMSETIEVEIELQIQQCAQPTLGVQLLESNQSPVFHFHTVDSSFRAPSTPGRHVIRAALPPMNLYPGDYLLDLTLCDAAGSRYTELHKVGPLSITIRQDPAVVTRALHRQAGLIFQPCDWRLMHANPLTKTIAAKTAA